MASWKKSLYSAAMKVANSPAAQKILANESFQSAVGRTIQTGFTVKEAIDDSKKSIAKQFGLSTDDDLREIKREVDRLQRQVARLREEQNDQEN